MRVWVMVGAALVLAALAIITLRLHPPGGLRIAAGPAGGAYIEVARSYEEILAQDKVRLDIVETAGSAENAELIEDGTVDAAFLQGGIDVDPKRAEAIGTVFFEPMVFLVRADALIPRNPALWTGLRINSGAQGSGTADAFRDFERVVGLTKDDNDHLSLPYDQAASALHDGTLDIAVFVAPIDAPYLLSAYEDSGLKLLKLDNVEAISRRLSYATVVTVPTGGMSLNPVLPSRPVELIALKARLVVRPDLHPALVNRLTMAAIAVHQARGIITDAGVFPGVDGTGLPINNTARQLILEGPSTWHDWLPYWVAAQVNRALLLFLPFFFIVLPLVRLLPRGYAYFQRWRVWQHYPEIRQIELELSDNPTSEDLKRMQQHLHALDEKLADLSLPAAYRQGQYDARLHLDLIQKRIAELQFQSQ